MEQEQGPDIFLARAQILDTHSKGIRSYAERTIRDIWSKKTLEKQTRLCDTGGIT
jgi:hypothetical protein